MPKCERCGTRTEKLYEITQENDFGELISEQVCWNCDHDVINGGNLFDEPWEVLEDRAENNHEYDPVDNQGP